MATNGDAANTQRVCVYQHSTILYWWPVWAVGLVLGVLTLVQGERVDVGGEPMWFHHSKTLGVVYVAVFATVFLATNVTVRGAASLVVLAAVTIVILSVSLLHGWDELLAFEQSLSVHMDAGFYLLSSLLLFVLWVLAVFVFDRFMYCEFRPGQIVLHNIVGGGSRTYGTTGASIYKLQDDPFRHWVLGLGSGDLHIATSGAEKLTVDIRNVAFIERKLQRIQRFMAMSPDDDVQG